MQRRHWAMEVLRAEGSRSVLDLGCGPGSLLQTLVVPSSTIPEKPIKDTERGDYPEGKELFITVSGARRMPHTWLGGLSLVLAITIAAERLMHD